MNNSYRYCSWFLILALGFSMCSFAVCYAASINSKDVDIKEESSKLPYEFYGEDLSDFSIKLHKNVTGTGRGKETENLEAYFTYDNNILKIDGVEAIDMKDLWEGRTSLSIGYRMVTNEETKEEDEKDIEYSKEETSLSEIPFFLSSEEPYWRIYNNEGTYGVGNIEGEPPAFLTKLLPKSLDNLTGYNQIKKADSKELEAEIIIEGGKLEDEDEKELNLSDLKLPEAVNEKLAKDNTNYATLEIMANYYFCIPLEFAFNKTTKTLEFKIPDENNWFISHSQIQGVVTLKRYFKVLTKY